MYFDAGLCCLLNADSFFSLIGQVLFFATMKTKRQTNVDIKVEQSFADDNRMIHCFLELNVQIHFLGGQV